MSTNNTKQAAWIAIGSLFSFGFSIISSMILSRYFDKVEYGTYKQVLYIYNSLLTVFTLGLPKAYSYFLPRSPLEQAKSLISKINNLFFLLGGILSILLFVLSGVIADIFRNPDLQVALKIFSPVPLLMMPTMGLEGILATYKKTKFVAAYTVLTRLIMLLCVALPVVIFGLSCFDALIGFVFGSFLAFILALILKYYPVKNERKDKTACTYKEIFAFAIPLFFASIWGVLINATDQFFISRYFGTQTFAEFSNGAMELPFVGMITGACATVLTPLFTKKVYENSDFKKEIFPVWNSSLIKSAMLIYPLVIFCLFDANIIMIVLYGDMYEASGAFFRIKLFTYFIKIIAYYSILMAIGATKFYSNVFMYTFFLLVPCEYLCVKLFDSPLLVTAVHVFFSISMCIVFFKYIAKYFSVSMVSLFPIKDIVKIILISILSSIFMISFHLIYENISNIIILFLDCIIYIIFYLLVSYWFRIDYLRIIRPLLTK